MGDVPGGVIDEDEPLGFDVMPFPLPETAEVGVGRGGLRRGSFEIFGVVGGGGIGGRPPFPRPLRMERVSLRRCDARSCCPRETRVNARVSMSEVRSSIRRCTTDG
jgi:hypothetical protein